MVTVVKGSRVTGIAATLQPSDDFTVKSVIGIGTFGAVFLAVDKSGKEIAIKKVCLDPRFKNRELDLVEKLEHPNCLRYIRHYCTHEGPQNDQYLHLVTDYLPESMTSFMRNYPFPAPVFIKVFGYQIFAALAYLHHHGVCHRDIKPSNVLLDHLTGRLQLCDFGSAKFLKPNESSVSYIATRVYRAPELLLDCTSYTTAIDIWAAGCVLTEMLLQGRSLFTGTSNNEVLNIIARSIGPPKPGDLDGFVHKKKFPFTSVKPASILDNLPRQWTPPEFGSLISRIFVYDPAKRLTAVQCMKHPFFADLFADDMLLPNKSKVPDYFKKMRTPEEMFKNFPSGPVG
jgi:glycogen synthase kinase 3 beta